MQAKITVLSGDGIGPEVTSIAVSLLKDVAARYGHTLTFTEALFGGCAIDEKGDSFPMETVATCEAADAVLLGSLCVNFVEVSGPFKPKTDPSPESLKKIFVCGEQTPACARRSHSPLQTPQA